MWSCSGFQSSKIDGNLFDSIDPDGSLCLLIACSCPLNLPLLSLPLSLTSRRFVNCQRRKESVNGGGLTPLGGRAESLERIFFSVSFIRARPYRIERSVHERRAPSKQKFKRSLVVVARFLREGTREVGQPRCQDTRDVRIHLAICHITC